MRINFTLDCNDLDAEARFWSAVLRFPATVVVPGDYVALEGPDFALTLQRADNGRTFSFWPYIHRGVRTSRRAYGENENSRDRRLHV